MRLKLSSDKSYPERCQDKPAQHSSLNTWDLQEHQGVSIQREAALLGPPGAAGTPKCSREEGTIHSHGQHPGCAGLGAKMQFRISLGHDCLSRMGWELPLEFCAASVCSQGSSRLLSPMSPPLPPCQGQQDALEGPHPPAGTGVTPSSPRTPSSLTGHQHPSPEGQEGAQHFPKHLRLSLQSCLNDVSVQPLPVTETLGVLLKPSFHGH